jgi:hypothetical protein
MAIRMWLEVLLGFISFLGCWRWSVKGCKRASVVEKHVGSFGFFLIGLAFWALSARRYLNIHGWIFAFSWLWTVVQVVALPGIVCLFRGAIYPHLRPLPGNIQRLFLACAYGSCVLLCIFWIARWRWHETHLPYALLVMQLSAIAGMALAVIGGILLIYWLGKTEGWDIGDL